VEQFAAIRRDHRVEGLSIRALADRHHVHRRTVRQALESAVPPPRRSPQRVSPRLEAVQGRH
jgi:lambda repressor-like predicted transcriptional regulator